MTQDIEYIENLDEWWYWRCVPPWYRAHGAEHVFRVTDEFRAEHQRIIYAWEWV